MQSRKALNPKESLPTRRATDWNVLCPRPAFQGDGQRLFPLKPECHGQARRKVNAPPPQEAASRHSCRPCPAGH